MHNMIPGYLYFLITAKTVCDKNDEGYLPLVFDSFSYVFSLEMLNDKLFSENYKL